MQSLEGRRRSLLEIWQNGEEIEFPMIIDEGNKVRNMISGVSSRGTQIDD